MATKARDGTPAWMVTFADLMSLLLAFFVLLFSFSELDNQIYKEVAGSMKDAFGVQRLIRVKQPPRGLNIVAREFSPGVPMPTTMNEVRQFTTKDAYKYPTLGRMVVTTFRDSTGRTGKEQHLQKIQLALKDEIAKGLIELEVTDRQIIVRIKEKGFFPSGSDRLEKPFEPVVQRLAQALKGTSSQLVISGHTDSVPIDNARFHSNWELSAARAVAVANVVLGEGVISDRRVHLEAYADTRPVDTNDSQKGRARNRRVELALVYGEDMILKGDGKTGTEPMPEENTAQGEAGK
jgi:chemotaxis protein MotB